jgi:hypothetical protein
MILSCAELAEKGLQPIGPDGQAIGLVLYVDTDTKTCVSQALFLRDASEEDQKRIADLFPSPNPEKEKGDEWYDRYQKMVRAWIQERGSHVTVIPYQELKDVKTTDVYYPSGGHFLHALSLIENRQEKWLKSEPGPILMITDPVTRIRHCFPYILAGCKKAIWGECPECKCPPPPESKEEILKRLNMTEEDAAWCLYGQNDGAYNLASYLSHQRYQQVSEHRMSYYPMGGTGFPQEKKRTPIIRECPYCEKPILVESRAVFGSDTELSKAEEENWDLPEAL